MTPMLALSSALGAAWAAETPPSENWLRVGVTAPYGVQPGLTLAASTDLATWQGRRRDAALSVGPRLAGFGRPHNHISGLLGAEASVRWTHSETGRFVSIDGGLGYLAAAQITEVQVDLGSGELERTRSLEHHFLPTLGVHFGRNAPHKVGWYAGLSAGRHLSPQTPDSLWFTAEAGVRFAFPAGGAR